MTEKPWLMTERMGVTHGFGVLFLSVTVVWAARHSVHVSDDRKTMVDDLTFGL